MRFSRRSVLYNASILTFSGVLLQILGFVYQVVVSRAAGAQGLGLYRLVSPVYAVVMAGTVSGVRLAVTSLSASLYPRGGMGSVRVLVRRSIAGFLLLFGAVGVPALLLRRPIAVHIIKEPLVETALVLGVVCVFFSGFEAIFESMFLGIGRTKYTAISNLLEQGVKIFLVIGLLAGWGEAGNHARTATLIMLGMVLSEIPVLIWLMFAYRRQLRLENRPCAGWSGCPRVLPIAAPVSATSVLTNLIASASVVLLPGRLALAGMTGEEAVAALGVVSEMALPLILLPMVLVRALANVLLPVISQSLARGNKADVGRKIRKSFQSTGLIVLPATAILVPLAPRLSEILYRQSISEAYVLLLAVGAVFTYYEVVSASILNGLGKQRANMVCMIVGEGIQLACTWFLAARPELNIYGYMLGMVLGPLCVVVLNLILIRRCSGFLPSLTDSFLIPLLASGVAGGFARYFYVTMRPQGQAGLGIIACAALLGGLLCFFVFVLTGVRPVRYVKSVLEPSGAKGRGDPPHGG